MRGNLSKTEKILLAAAAGFLCLLAAAGAGNRPPAGSAAVETQYAAARSQIAGEAEKINLNTATAAELQELPGIGETLAGRITDYRAEHGPFRSIGEIKNVSGIGEGIFSGLEDQITVEEDAS